MLCCLSKSVGVKEYDEKSKVKVLYIKLNLIILDCIWLNFFLTRLYVSKYMVVKR